jgi:PAS domain S-box-containing protein
MTANDAKTFNGSRMIWAAVLIVYVISFLDLIGWMAEISLLTNFGYGLMAMNGVTAICLILSASALVIIKKYNSGPGGLAAIITGLFVGLAGLLTVIVYLKMFVAGGGTSVINTPVLKLFLDDSNRMPFLTGVIFILTGCTIVLLALRSNMAADLAHLVILPAAAGSYLVLVSYFLGVQSMHEFLGTSVTLNTGIACCFVCLAVFFIRPESWLMKVLTGNLSGSMMARRLLPGLFVLPVLIGWLRLYGERVGLFNSEIGVVLVVIVYSVCFVSLVWYTAMSVNRADAKRRKYQDDLRYSENNLHAILDATQESIYMVDRQGILVAANSTGARRFNRSLPEMIGHHFSEFLPEYLAMQRQEKFNTVIATGKPVQFEDERNGLHFFHNFYPVYENGEITRVVTFSQDITERQKIHEALLISEEKFKVIATNTPDHIMIQDADLRYITVINPQLGLTEMEMIGKTDHDLLSEQDAEKLTEIKKNVIRSGASLTLIVPLTDKVGRVTFFEGSYIPKYNLQGTPAGIMGYFRNVTPRIKMEEELQARELKFRNLFENRNDGIMITEMESKKYIDCNKRLESMTGYSREEIMSMSTGMLLSSSRKEEEIANVDRLRAGEVLHSETEVVLKDGGILPVEFIASTTVINNRLCIVSVIRDITERKTNELVLKRNIEQLETYALELKNLNATKDKFFRIIAHDLKNPFSSLLGGSELLSKNAHQFSPEKIKYLCEILNDSAQSGYNLLENLLEWSKTQTGNINFNPVKLNLKVVADRHIGNLNTPAADKEILLRSEIKKDLHVVADKYMLDTVLRNLMNNAIKFTHNHGTVTLHAQKNLSHVTLTVKDSGIGIEKENIEKLFKIDTKFFRTGTANERGTGLGLLLCKEFVERHGGRLWVESEFGKGSEFNFTLPLRHKSKP